jgi:zinc protease
MSLHCARLLLAAVLFAGCTSRPELPAPTLPLTRTPDADFRSRAPVPDIREIPAPPQVQERMLRNGASVLVVERPSRPVATVAVVVRRAGRESASEPRGLGALVARTLRFGTRLADGREIATPSLLGQMPAVLSTEDSVVIALDTHAVAVPEAVGLVASLAARPVFTDAGFALAVSEQLDAIALSSRSSGDHLRQAALERLYGEGHVLSQPLLGRSEQVRAIPLSRISAFHAARYRPEDTALVVVGDVSAGQVFDAAERELGVWSSGAPAQPREPAPAVVEYRGERPLVAFSGYVGMTTLMLAIPGPGGADPEWHAYWLAATAVSGHALSRGQQALSHHDVKSYAVTRGSWIRETSSDLFISFSVEHDDIADSLTTMLNLVSSLGDAPLGQAELARVRAGYLAALTDAYASNRGCAALLASFFTAARPASELGALRARVLAITAADVQRAARRWFSKKRLQIAAFTRVDEGGYDLTQFGRVHWFGLEKTVTK